ncbi:glycine-rich cell wall structural protein 1.8 [Rhagoletis pomonella]|uniref:glycine-rich cell wall structural protein 1.8 n=1 Tax=Rhagoletis pomonella TaxID=28610 RepID=UPI00178549B0|nr:glycine-rich cell wall structural protein 1.8 [Rhagoletis pomonella]
MKPSLKLRQAGVILLALNCVLFCSAQGGRGGAGGWAGASGSPGAPGMPGAPGTSDYGFGYGGVDSRGNTYGGAGGNGGYYVGGIDDQGRRFAYSGGAGGMPGMPGAPGGYPVAPGSYPNTRGYPDYYDQRYRSSANAKFTQMNSLWLLILPIAMLTRFL